MKGDQARTSSALWNSAKLGMQVTEIIDRSESPNDLSHAVE